MKWSSSLPALLLLVPSQIATAALPDSGSVSVADSSADAPPATPPNPAHRNESQGIMAPRATGPDSLSNRYRIFGSLKFRLEDTSYFASHKADGSYLFAGGIARFGLRRETHTDDMLVELATPFLINVPTRASAPAPQGALGQGANYFAGNGAQVASLFVKQAYEQFKAGNNPQQTVKLGRFEFTDGAELRSANAALAYLKQNRIANRLVSPNPFSYIGRSFDGISYAAKGGSTLQAVAAMPTRGGYDLSGADTLTGIRLGYVSLNRQRFAETAEGRTAVDSRLFAIYYNDARNVVKTDNRSSAARAADHGEISITTVGFHDIHLIPAGRGRADTLTWAALQGGKWGALSHGAFAADLEVGYAPPDHHLHPWYRAGWYYGSGDGDGTNGRHGTFFPMLPSGRTYARFPFFATSNLRDAFGEVVLRPNSRTLLRADMRGLGLANAHDLYYSGSGAYDNSSFGYTGRPSGGSTSLASLYDTSVDYQINKNSLVIFYMGFAHGGATLRSIYNSRDAAFAYLELQHRF